MEANQLSLFDAPAPGEYPIPEDGEVSRCRSCQTSIVWAKTEGGKPIPLDLSRVRVVAGQRHALNHFATCPHSREWRRR